MGLVLGAVLVFVALAAAILAPALAPYASMPQSSSSKVIDKQSDLQPVGFYDNQQAFL